MPFVLLLLAALRVTDAAVDECRSRPSAAEAVSCLDEIDDGVHRFTWFDGGSVGWAVGVAPEDDRMERAAKTLLAEKRTDEARDVLSDLLPIAPSGWAREHGWSAAGGGAIPGFDPEPVPFWGHPWFPPLPDIEIPLMTGGQFDLGSARGSVVLLDFWATWCPPCLIELPHLQALYEREKANGLTALAINADEPKDVALPAAAKLGLAMPIGVYGDSLRSAFPAETLPVVIVADRRGRIRRRWDGYHAGMEKSIAKTVRTLLGDDPEGAPRKLGEALTGSGLLALDWSRETEGVVGGLAILGDPEGSIRIAASGGGTLHLLDPDGELVAWQEGSRIAGPLRSDSARCLVEFRSGGLDVTVYDLTAETSRTWQYETPILDVAVLPAAPPRSNEPRLVLGTLGGVFLTGLDGATLRSFEGIGEVSRVAVEGDALVALETRGRVRRASLDGKDRGSTEVPEGSWRLATSGRDGTGWGVAPSAVVDAVAGRFVGDEGRQVAIATVSGVLLLVDAASGDVLFRASWAGVTDLAAADLDGDGRDDLLVASDRFVSRLRAADRDTE